VSKVQRCGRRGRRDWSRRRFGTTLRARGDACRYFGRTEKRLRATAAGIDDAGGQVLIKVTDATREKDVVALFDEADVEADVELVVYNVGNNVAAPALDTTSELFEGLWRQNALGGFLVAARRSPARASPERNNSLYRRDCVASRAAALHRLCLRQGCVARCAQGWRANLRLKASISLMSS